MKVVAILSIIAVASAIITICEILKKNPFEYPFFKHSFDVSGKRNQEIENLIEEYIIEQGFQDIQHHQCVIENWKESCNMQLESYKFLKSRRQKQFERVLNSFDNKPYIFEMVRSQTRYKQRNYVKEAYKVNIIVGESRLSYSELVGIYNNLKEIGFETTLKKYHSNQQRKLMTKELRLQIMERDNYTCKICGKYMPDQIGLQIDHILPVSKGGKSIPSNLQVLCSKCNGSKSNKIIQ